MKKLYLLIAGMIGSLSVCAQTADDPVIMKINGKEITRSEFEYSFNKNNSEGVIDKKSINDYVPRFVNLKLKVAAAESEGIDTVAAIRKELRGYKEQIVLPTIVNNDFIEAEAHKTYDATAKRFEGQDLLTASHILVMMRQDASEQQQAVAKVRIDSIYNALKAGADFATLAKQCSDDKGSAQRGGALGQFAKGMMIPEFETAAYALKPGQMSKPIKTTVGWHIILLEDRHPFEPFEHHREAIIAFLMQRGIKEASQNAYVDSVARVRGVSRDLIIDEMYDNIIAKDMDARYLAQEYYDGTLMFEVSKENVWDKAAKDTEGLQAHFLENRKQYAWDAPRFKGIVIRGKDEQACKDAKKAIKGVEETKWVATITSALNTDSVKAVRVERGLYKKGDNGVVDKLAFKDKNAKVANVKAYPSVAVSGKMLKQPASYEDVRSQVTSDYQAVLEQRWVEQLRKKYSVEINESVVSTVNKH